MKESFNIEDENYLNDLERFDKILRELLETLPDKEKEKDDPK